MSAPIRWTKQLEADLWASICKVCPKRYGRRTFRTQQAANAWWTEHVRSTIHTASIRDDSRKTAEMQMLEELFGPAKHEQGRRIPPSEREGTLTIRPGGHIRRDQD